MKPASIFRKSVKSAFQAFGMDIIRRKNNPSLTLLGLRELPFHTIIDVGANTGQFAKKISSFFPKARLYCFEPLPEPFDTLTSWARTKKGRVTTFNLAIGEEEGKVEMFLHKDHTPSSSLLATTELSEQYYPFTKEQKCICVRQTTLDVALEEVAEELLPGILVKLDVQGYEDRVIAGGPKIFSKTSACILEVCLDSLYEDQAGFTQLVSTLEDFGLRYSGNLVQVYGEDGHCIFLDAVFLRRT